MQFASLTLSTPRCSTSSSVTGLRTGARWCRTCPAPSKICPPPQQQPAARTKSNWVAAPRAAWRGIRCRRRYSDGTVTVQCLRRTCSTSCSSTHEYFSSSMRNSTVTVTVPVTVQ
eukprot:9466196-Pyramimonas_sp.AAC.1